MNNILLLIKTNIINQYKINYLLKANKTDRAKYIGIAAAVIWSLIAFSGIIYSYFSMIATPLKQIGQLDIILYQVYAMVFFIVLGTSIYKSQGMLFGIKDFDSLISLPITKTQILISKLTELYLNNIIFVLILVIPSYVVYYKNSEVSSLFYINLLVLTLFMPLIPIVIASILGLAVAFISSKMKNTNLFMIVGTAIMIVAFMILPQLFSRNIETIIANSEGISSIIGKILPQANLVVSALKESNYIDLMLFIGISTIIFAVFSVFMSRIFVDINKRFTEKYKKNNFKMKTLKTSSPLIALLKKEFSRYFSSPIYVINTLIMPIILTIGFILMNIFAKDMINSILAQEIFPRDYLVGLVVLAISSLSVIQPTTAVSISLEGKNFWIIKSLPIKFKDIIMSKALVNMIVFIPLNIINSFLAMSILHTSFVEGILILIIPVVVTIYMSFLGLIINILFPRFDFNSDTQIVKQSLSVIMVMIVGIIPFILGIYLYNILSINIIMYLIISLIALMLLTGICILFIMTKGKKLFKKL